MLSSTASVFDVLRDLEQRSIQCVQNVTDDTAGVSVWAGLAFMVAGIRVLAPMNEVSEILSYPPTVTRVPGARQWVKGVANIRGNLLPIIDLQFFLTGKPVITGRRSRVLVVNRSGVISGLLVGDVQGMRHFNHEDSIDSVRVEGVIGRFIQGAFENDEGLWPVLGMDKLVGDESFRMAAA